jgi:hypothetical protein
MARLADEVKKPIREIRPFLATTGRNVKVKHMVCMAVEGIERF